MDPRPPIPAAVRRQLRREAGFGCCLCGSPFIEYHHITPWHEAQRHEPADMMVVCPNDHARITAGAVPVAKQRAAKAHPVNIARGLVHGTLGVLQTNLALDISGSTFIDYPTVLRVNSEDLIALRIHEDGYLALSLRLYGPDDDLVCEIVDNEWRAGDHLPWDIEFKHRTLRMNRADRLILLDLDARKDLVTLRGEFWRSGHHFRFLPTRMETTHPSAAFFITSSTFNGGGQGAAMVFD